MSDFFAQYKYGKGGAGSTWSVAVGATSTVLIDADTSPQVHYLLTCSSSSDTGVTLAFDGADAAAGGFPLWPGASLVISGGQEVTAARMGSSDDVTVYVIKGTPTK